MIGANAQANGLNVVQLLANVAYLTAGGFGLYKLIDRAFGRKVQEHVAPVMDALVTHMAAEEQGMKVLAKGQKKIAKRADQHALLDVTRFDNVDSRFDAVDARLVRIERQGADAASSEIARRAEKGSA